MKQKVQKPSFLKTYGFLIFMIVGIVAGCVVGGVFPQVTDANGEVVSKGATVLAPLGKLFINLMFCVVVPMVFFSISSAIANMKSAKRAGKLMGTKFSLLMNIIIGILGGFLGGLILGLVGFGATNMIGGLITGVAGSCLLIYLAKKYIK
jgi:Na+/H+-dicarboxylate symporter